jgi:eukaryotic-like serine/threonine-protein kinase
MEPVQTPRVFSNRYELTHLIARGGMAQVYRARDRLLDRPVALKVLFPELSVDRAFVERFRREAQAAANLSHPNIVPVFDWGEDGGTYFIVMEFVDGQPLSAILRSHGPLAAKRVADIGAHVAAALAYAHRHGVIHRDVKPGNVLITDDGQVKVTDFGIARAVNTEESLTQTGAVMGTATYFSPEQAEGIGVDARTDVYSLGVVLFEMVAGRPPFLGETPVSVASKHVRDEPPPLRSLRATVPPDLEAVIAKAMAKTPDQRYASADDLRADLLRFRDGRPVLAGDAGTTQLQRTVGATAVVGAVGRTQAVPATPDDDVDDDEARKKRTRRLVVALVLLLVILGVIAFFLVRALSPSSTFALPNVAGQPEATAKATLQGRGLTVDTSHATSTTKAVGIVLRTAPAAGSQVKKGDTVTLVVSSGPPKADVTVPDVTTKTVTTATSTLRAKGFAVTVQAVKSSKPNGTVIKQTPVGGTRSKSGSTVKLTVSEQSSVKVPNVVGHNQATAGASLSDTGLKVGSTTSACSNAYSSGLVSAQNPAAGAGEVPGTVVNLTISSGPCQAVVPGVVGQTVTAAKSTLGGKGFNRVSAVTTSTCKTTTNGKVVSQKPSAGASISTGTPVTLSVCNNTTPPSTTTVPSSTTTVPSPTTTTSTTVPSPTTTTSTTTP